MRKDKRELEEHVSDIIKKLHEEKEKLIDEERNISKKLAAVEERQRTSNHRHELEVTKRNLEEQKITDRLATL